MDHVLKVIRAPGRPLHSECRGFMEQMFATDLRHVRVHDDADAATSCRRLGARAYAIGNHIVFGAGQFDCQSIRGRRLLAHELVHTLQQKDSALDFGRNPVVDSDTSLFEAEAELVEHADIWESGRADGDGLITQITPRQRAVVCRAVTKVCVAPSEALDILFPGLDPAKIIVSKAVGLLAEELITLDYLDKRPGRILFDHYFDNPLPMTYLSFLISKNPHLRNPFTIALLALDLNTDTFGIKRPDILTDMLGIRELYEIKPNSVSGLAEGRAKLAAISGFQIVYRLTYPRGRTFSPTPSIPIAKGTIPMFVGGPLPFELTLSAARTRPGLIQYKVCLETDFLKAAVNELILIAIILIILVTKRVPGLPPIPVPGGLPMPVIP